jgi:hypothetical protein
MARKTPDRRNNARKGDDGTNQLRERVRISGMFIAMTPPIRDPMNTRTPLTIA